VRDPEGTIRLVDDGSIVTPAPHGPPGDVLVRIAASSQGAYREPPATRALRIWNGHREGVATRDEEVATRALRRAVAVAASLAMADVVVAVALDVCGALSSMS